MIPVGDVGAGHMLGRYELLIPIASGGMASVWAARIKGPRGFQKIVAVKMMLTEIADDPDFEKMFLDEARTASRIKHPNVVEIVDLGEQEGVLYQVMEWVDGEPLNLVIRDGRSRAGIPPRFCARIGADACAGLHAAHELTGADGKLVGLVHRDVTPGNVLVGYDGSVKVVDFGVAKSSANAQQTRVGQTKGKVPYMSPEQARGDAVDRRTDVFALGIVLYQLATGKHPFRGDTELATLRAICDKSAVRSPREIVPAVPEAIEAILLRALAKDREQRFPDMAQMGRALEEAIPPAERADAHALGAFMRELLGERGGKRRKAITGAAHVADERTGLRGGRPDGEEAPPSSRARPARAAVDPPNAERPPPSTRNVAASAPSAGASDDEAAPSRGAPSEEDLARLVARPGSQDRSAIGALVAVGVLVAVIAFLYFLTRE